MKSKTELIVTGRFENLAEISRFIGRAASQTGLDERAIYAVQMAVDEACTNIIQHAYGDEEQGQIELTCHCQPEGLQVIICDQGRPFDPAAVPPLNTQAPLAERQPGNMGLFFIRRLVDTVEFQFNTPQGNRLTLFKRREPSA